MQCSESRLFLSTLSWSRRCRDVPVVFSLSPLNFVDAQRIIVLHANTTHHCCCRKLMSTTRTNRTDSLFWSFAVEKPNHCYVFHSFPEQLASTLSESLTKRLRVLVSGRISVVTRNWCHEKSVDLRAVGLHTLTSNAQHSCSHRPNEFVYICVVFFCQQSERMQCSDWNCR